MSFRIFHWLIRGGLLPLLTIVLLAGCGRGGDENANQDADTSTTEAETSDERDAEDDEELVPVEVVTLGRGSIESVLRFSTNLEAENEVQVFSEASRQIVELLVEEGDRVRKGQVLLRLQDEEQRSRLAQAESQHQKAEREYKRQQNLFEKELVSEQAFNDATFEVDQRRLELEDAQRELGYTIVRAPIKGTITGRMVNVGDHITVNQHLFDLVDFDSIVARVFVPEREITRLRTGQVARIESESLGAEARAGRVLRIAPIVDARTGTVKTTIAIPRNQGLLPGMYVEVELVTEVREDALLVPKRALIYDNDQSFLFRLVDGEGKNPTVERLRIEPRLDDRDFVETVDTNLTAGDRVVIAGQAGLKDGAEVKLLEAQPAASTAAAEPTDTEDAA